MSTDHIDKLIDAYHHNQLSADIRRNVELHIKSCPHCARLLFDTQRLNQQLGPTLHAALGRPAPPPLLRYKIRAALQARQKSRRFAFNWTIPGQIFNTIGTVAVMALLAFGLFAVIQGQIPGLPPLAEFTPIESGASSRNVATARPAPGPTPTPQAVTPSRPLRPHYNSLGDTLTLPASPTARTVAASSPVLPGPLSQMMNNDTTTAGQPEPEKESVIQNNSAPTQPTGTLVFGLYNPNAQMYEVHLINPDGSNHRWFPLSSISEPALHPVTKNKLAFRAWGEPASERSLFSSDLSGEQAKSITNFWEDAQPDWSPTENRIIFASQRESDRRWRLYTAWGDGSLEVNLRREGKSPTFAPDGYRFVFESCDEAGNFCGLWLGDLEHSEYDSKPILTDTMAKSPDWSPVNEQIAYMTNPNGDWDLYLVNSDGSKARPINNDPANDGLPAWSPDGKWLAFVSDRGEEWGLWVLRLSSGELHQVVAFDSGSLTPPNDPPYNEHGERYWWDEQLSWGP